MPGVLKISDAASIAIHAMVYLALLNDSELASTKQIADAYGVSEAHLSKVIQRLAHSGLVKTYRGPKGGISLAKSAEKITLLNVYESMEGSFSNTACLLGTKKCGSAGCILGDLLQSVNKQVKTRLSETKLSDLVLSRHD
jgi:Rrf2 family protein